MRFPDWGRLLALSFRRTCPGTAWFRLVLQDRDDLDTAHPLILCKCHTDDGVTADLFRLANLLRRNVYASRLVPVF